MTLTKTKKSASAKKLPSGNIMYRGWNSDRKYREAARLYLTEGMSQRAACVELGISRSRFVMWINNPDNSHVVERVKTDAENAKQLAKSGGVTLAPLAVYEKRRTGTVHEFVDRYFSWLVCPDCRRHHEVPGFHREIHDALQDPDSPRVLINIPPYHSKSTSSVIDTIYDVCTDPNSRTILVSKSQVFARTFLHQVQELLTNEDLYSQGHNLVKDWGPFNDGTNQWSNSQIYVAGRVTAEKDPTILSIGYGNQIYGRRADKIKADDVATLDNQRNPDQVVKMMEWFDKEVASRIGARGKLAWIGTRVAPGDIYDELGRRQGYRILRYPCIMDEVEGKTLWPDHFTYDHARARRDEMRADHFQLVYQQVALPGTSADFSIEAINECKNTGRLIGQFDSNLRLVAGLDLAGGGEKSGYTAGVLLGVDLHTQKRYVIDVFNEKSLRAPRLKEKIFEWTDQYPIYLWKVERNGIQAQLVQYSQEITQYLASKGTRVEGHQTGTNKWDEDFGVASMAPLFNTGLIDLPWQGPLTAQRIQPLIDQLIAFPLGQLSDLVMAPLDVDTPVWTATGWRTMASVAVGDLVATPSGDLAPVIAKTPVSRQPVWKLTFDDGAELRASADHRWWVQPVGLGSQPLEERWMTTAELIDHPFKRVRVKRNDPIEAPERDLLVDPYVLGVWLGDGDARQGTIYQHDDDAPHLRAEIEMAGYPTTDQKRQQCFGILGLRGQLVELGVLGNKYIPLDYLHGSVKQRLALLQGLMDTDGHALFKQPQRGRCVFGNANKDLVDGVNELALGLGFRTNMQYEPACRAKSPQGGWSDRQPFWRVLWTADASTFCPFRLPRKAERCAHVREKRRDWLTVRTVTPDGEADVQCLTVDHPSHVFLAGRHLTPTGNCWFAEIGARQILRRGHLPLFSSRQKAGRHGRLIVDFATNEIQQVGASLTQQGGDGQLGGRYQRLLSGRVGGYRRPMAVLQDPMEQRELEAQGFVNVEESHLEPDREH